MKTLMSLKTTSLRVMSLRVTHVVTNMKATSGRKKIHGML